MSERGFEFLTDEKLESLSLDELKAERKLVQDERQLIKPYLHKITLLINGILQENEALKKLTPEAAEALGAPKDKVNMIRELQKKRKEAIAKGNGDVVIQHRHTLTMTPGGVKKKGGGN